MNRDRKDVKHVKFFFFWDGTSCPCCKMRLRSASRYVKLKEKTIPLIRI